MSLFDFVRDLPLEIESVSFEPDSQEISPQFTRRTTTIGLSGAGLTGFGEDVTYDGDEHAPDRLPELGAAGTWTLESFSKHLDAIDLFPQAEPGQAAYRDYRRWGVESAALDLALQQDGRSLGEAIGRDAKPLKFVSSTRATSLDGWLALYPDLRFKLDPTPDWTDEFFESLAASGRIDVADLKGAYHGTVVDQPPNAVLYKRVAEKFPNAWIEDPALGSETDEVLAPHRDRITWDAPIHSWADVEALPFPPRCLNSKPSRFGSVERLFEFYDRCAEHGIALYGGGQFELGVGRGHIQLLAGLFHPEGSNDTAPGGYNAPAPLAGLPTSPLDPRPAPTGFRREP
jgi:hypothetical protein